MGDALRTVAAAYAAVSNERFTELAPLISPQIDWRGLPDAQTGTPGCRGRAAALERMRVGLLAGGAVSVSALIEQGDRVLAQVRPAPGAQDEVPERFLVAEVHGGQITELRGYATEAEARAALSAPSLPDATAPVNGT